MFRLFVKTLREFCIGPSLGTSPLIWTPDLGAHCPFRSKFGLRPNKTLVYHIVETAAKHNERCGGKHTPETRLPDFTMKRCADIWPRISAHLVPLEAELGSSQIAPRSTTLQKRPQNTRVGGNQAMMLAFKYVFGKNRVYYGIGNNNVHVPHHGHDMKD